MKSLPFCASSIPNLIGFTLRCRRFGDDGRQDRDQGRLSDILRHIFERVVAACMANGLIKGEGFAVDASVIEANDSRYHGKAPGELDWTDAQRQKRAVAEYLAALETFSTASVRFGRSA
jgi:hypothetical protein